MSAAACVARSSAQLTVRPVRTPAAAAAVRSGVSRLRAPRSSSTPQRPQFFAPSKVVSNHARSCAISSLPAPVAGGTRNYARCVAARALVIGGTGPTGIPIVRGARRPRARRHDPAPGHARAGGDAARRSRTSTPTRTTRRRSPTRSADATWDVVVAMYGRLRRIAELTAGECGQFVSVGGVPAYRGWTNPWLFEPAGLPVPVAEDAPTVTDPAIDEKGYRIVRTEQAVFAAHPNAAHFRYPYVYGPVPARPARVARRAPHPRRPATASIVADDGLTLHHHGYTENLRARGRCWRSTSPSGRAARSSTSADEEVLTRPPGHRARRRARSVTDRDRVDALRARRPGLAAARAAAADPPRARPHAASAPSSATATSCRHARPSAEPRAGSPSTRPSRAVRRRPCSPTRSTTRPRTGSWTRGSRRARSVPTPSSRARPATASPTAAPAGGRAPSAVFAP